LCATFLTTAPAVIFKNQQHCYQILFLSFLFFPLELGGLIKYIRPFLKMVSKAKAAKLVRNLVDVFLDMEASTGMEVGCLGN